MGTTTAFRFWPRWVSACWGAIRHADERIIRQAREMAQSRHQRPADELTAQASQIRRQAANRPFSGGFLAQELSLFIEALSRATGLAAYDTQLLAGLVMARGGIAEMATGEGKTLAAACAASLLALSGRSVHVVTPNRYLAGRDQQLAGPVMKLLGVDCALLPEGGDLAAKRIAYRAPVVYGTGYEFGFDYLRDQLALRQERQLPLGQRALAQLSGQPAARSGLLQRRLDCALIDEIDSVLIDEAGLPLVLSGDESEPGARAFQVAHHTAQRLAAGADFLVSSAQRSVSLTNAGRQKLLLPPAESGRLPLARPWATYVEQALHAQWVLRRDQDYVVQGDKVLLVDQQTGRIFPDRTWQSGLHQAVEAKENLPIQTERGAAARISRQRYFRRYQMLGGLTGTVGAARGEFRDEFGLGTTSIPLRKPCRRELLKDRFFRDEASKLRAIAAEISVVAGSGRAVLAGTRTIDCSRRLSDLLTQAGISHRLLNGTQTEDEAQIVARAGEPGAITIATNMAGRGTDIQLAPTVADRGGLMVLGAERHELSRVDRQLAGRAARQGDPGSCRFYVSADDEFLVRSGESLRRKLQRLPHQQGEIQGDFSAQVAAIQRAAERAGRQSRQKLAAHDRWLDELQGSGGS